MTKRHTTKHKIDRRLGENIWGRPKSPVNRRPYGPGEQGQKRRSKLSDFGIQLRAKQKLKGYYGNINEKQFRRIYGEAQRMRGDTSENLIGLLERRLDAVLYHACFAPTVFAARQMINHGHVRVNNRRLNIASARLSPGDVVTLRQESREMPIVLQARDNEERMSPEYLKADYKKMMAQFLRVPRLEEVPYPVRMEPQLVVEFYAKN